MASKLNIAIALILLALNAFPAALRASEGELDASRVGSGKVLSLKTSWQIFDNEILSPAEALARLREPDYHPKFEVPGQGFQNSELYPEHPGFGSMTYLLKLKNLPLGKYAGFGQSIYTSSRIYIFSATRPDVSPVIDLGINAEHPKESAVIFAKQPSFSFSIEEPVDHYILIQAANFFHPWGGLWQIPRIGFEDVALREVQRNTQLEYLTIGIVFFVAIYSFSLFLRRTEDKASLVFGLCALFYVIRSFFLSTIDQNYFDNYETSWVIAFKVTNLYYTLGAVLFISFIRLAFPNSIPRLYHILAWASQLPAYAIIIATPPIIYYTYCRTFLDASSLFFSIIILIYLIRCAIRKESGALYCLSGYLFLGTAAVNDLSWSVGLPYFFFPALGVGYSFFFLLNSQVIAMRFSVAFRTAEKLSKDLQLEVDRQTRDIKTIMANIKQGIFTIEGIHQPIGKDHSDHLALMFPEDNIEAKNLSELLLDQSDLDSDQKDQILSALDAGLGDNVITFEINRAHLPDEITFRGREKNRILALDWNPVLNAQSELEKVLISVRDVTALRELETANMEREKDMQILIELVQISEGRFQRFIIQAREFLNDNEELIKFSDKPRSDIVKRMFMNMHTLKGAARTLLLRSLSNIAHEVEKEYEALINEKKEWDQRELLSSLNSVKDLVRKYQNLGEEKLGWHLEHVTIKMPCQIGESVVEDLMKVMKTGLAEKQIFFLDRARSKLFDFCLTRFEDVVKDAFSGVDSMARDLKKMEPRIIVKGIKTVLKSAGVDLVHKVFVHLIRNSMDHGIEVPEERVRKQKNPQGTITVLSSREDGGRLLVSFFDDGAGLNLERITECAKRAGYILQGQELSDQEKAELIFYSGLTTKDTSSEISGRGVGMDAVRNFVRDQGGDVKIVLGPFCEAGYISFQIQILMPETIHFQIDHDH